MNATSDQAEVVIEDFLDKKEKLNARANRHRDLRDRLNDQTKQHAQRRDELNAQVRSLIDEANGHKAKRDELNQDVRTLKAKRDDLNRVANEKADALNALKKDKMPRDGFSIGKLKHRLRQLEYEHQTKVLSPKAEKDLIDQMGSLQKEIAGKENVLEGDATLKAAYDEMRIAKTDAEDQHKNVTIAANSAQSEHDSMVKLFESADKVRKQADGAQADFIKSKQEADKVHHEYIEMVNQIRDFEKVILVMRSRERGRRSEYGHAAAKQEAEDIFQKFKGGEKLSTEDLMVLQKAGLL